MRLIDADELVNKAWNAETMLDFITVVEFDDIMNAPTIDAVPVVRCKDCVHSRERNSYEKEYLVEGVVICTNSDVHDDAWGAMCGDDFCSYGERKDGEE